MVVNRKRVPILEPLPWGPKGAGAQALKTNKVSSVSMFLNSKSVPIVDVVSFQ